MKKIVCCIFLVSIITLFVVINQQIGKKRGEGTEKSPYFINDVSLIQSMEKDFADEFDSIFKNDINKYKDDTDSVWKVDKKGESDIQIQSVHYIGNQMQSNMMIIYTCDGVQKELKEDVVKRFKDDRFMITTSYNSLDLNLNKKVDSKLFDSKRADLFSLRLADDILNNSAKMIVTYNLKYKEKWYQLTTLVHIDNPSYLQIPNKEYGEGNIITSL